MSVEEGRRNYENNTTASAWLEGIGDSAGIRLANNAVWKVGLIISGVENTDDIPDEVWSGEWNDAWERFTGDEESVRSASLSYASSTTADAWGDEFGDASNWDV